MNEPKEIRKGLSETWTESINDYPATNYTLKYNLQNSSANVAIVSTADGNAHTVILTASTTAGYTAGTYKWQSYVENISDSDEKVFIAQGTIEIVNTFLSGNTDQRSHARKTLEAIEAVIENRATQDHLSYSIAGRSISLMTLKELIEAESIYAYKVKQEELQERINEGKDVGNKILVRFNN